MCTQNLVAVSQVRDMISEMRHSAFSRFAYMYPWIPEKNNGNTAHRRFFLKRHQKLVANVVPSAERVQLHMNVFGVKFIEASAKIPNIATLFYIAGL